MWHGFVLCKDGNKSCKASKDSFKHANNPQLDTKANRASLLSPTRCWRTARPPAGLHPPAARCGRPPEKSIKYFRKNKKNWWRKHLKPKIFEEKKLEKIGKKNLWKFFRNYFFRFSKFFFRRNLSYDEYITHAKFPNHRSRGFGATGANGHTDLRIYYIDLLDLLLSRRENILNSGEKILPRVT